MHVGFLRLVAGLGAVGLDVAGLVEGEGGRTVVAGETHTVVVVGTVAVVDTAGMGIAVVGLHQDVRTGCEDVVAVVAVASGGSTDAMVLLAMPDATDVDDVELPATVCQQSPRVC